ncbi:MAG: hypothetical protein ABL907_05300 [Hyphomicrobium sp.]
MATEQQITANRLNAMRSTGPATPEGKAASRRNALKHGLTAKDVVIEGEDPELFVAYRQGLLHELAPLGAIEQHLADLVIFDLWRLLRVPKLEAALFAFGRKFYDEVCAAMPPLPGYMGPTDDEAEAKAALGGALNAILKDQDLLAKLNRYEITLINKVRSCLFDLKERQALRLKKGSANPLVD